MELQALDLTVFPHSTKSCLSRCHQSPVPAEPCGVNPSQRLGRPAPPLRAPDTAQGKVLSEAGPQLPPTATLHPPLSGGSTHLCSHTLSQMAGLIPLEARLPAKGRGLCPRQAGPTGQPCLGPVQVRVGCLHLHTGASHLPLKQMGASAQQTSTAGLCLQLALL